MDHRLDEGLQAFLGGLQVPDRLLAVEPLVALKERLAAHLGQIDVAQSVPVHGLASAQDVRKVHVLPEVQPVIGPESQPQGLYAVGALPAEFQGIQLRLVDAAW